MLQKELDYQVDQTTFPAKKVPLHLAVPTPIAVDVGLALLMLGSITVPGGFTSACPAQFWAWLRYLSAISTSPTLRITAPFTELDPHQKTILSDDLGVAICATWLHTALGGAIDIVDGRRFMLDFAHLTRNLKTHKPPKVGKGKCPDFVILDKGGKWHVLECKGTQSGAIYRDKQLQSAVLQKVVIAMKGKLRGQRLGVGLAIGSDLMANNSHLRVVDPEPWSHPYVTVYDEQENQARVALRRLSLSRVLGLAGFEQLSAELSLPPSLDERFQGFFYPLERERLRRPHTERMAAAITGVRDASPMQFSEDGHTYSGRAVSLDVPGDAFFQNTGSRGVRVRLGVRTDFVEQLRQVESDFDETIDALANVSLQTGLTTEASAERTVIRNGTLFSASLALD